MRMGWSENSSAHPNVYGVLSTVLVEPQHALVKWYLRLLLLKYAGIRIATVHGCSMQMRQQLRMAHQAGR